MVAGNRQSGHTLLRTCPHCDQALSLEYQHIGQTACCPACGGAVPPGTEEAVPTTGSRRPSGRFDTAAGWSVSALTHIIVLAALAQITWMIGLGPGNQPAEVGIVADPDGPSIESGSAELEAVDFPVGDIPPLQADLTDTFKPIENAVGLAMPTHPTAVDPIVGVNIGSGAGEDAWLAVGALGAGAGGGGADFYGLRARGRRFVYVLDRSSSMSGAKLAAVKHELERSISGLKSNMRFFIIFYNTSFEPMAAKQLVPATGRNRSTYLAWAQALGARGGTDPTGAVLHALSLKPEAIWLLSDGLFADSAADAIRKANPGRRIQIHTIGFYDNAGEQILRRIAEENRGRYRFVPPGAGGSRP